MAEELDLYGTGINWKKATAIFATVSLIVTVFGFFGYRWLTTSTPVSRDRALQMFQQESAQADAGQNGDANSDGSKNDAGGRGTDKDGARSGSGSSGGDHGSGGGGSSPKNDQTAVAAGTESTRSSGGSEPRGSQARRGYDYPTTPDEGVYSWDTDGWEEAAGIRRDFPRESQRIITASNGSSWRQHHYFSEEREIWSHFVITKKGAHMAMQRNRAKFGPVTNDSTIDFSPPMLVGLPDPKVGHSWNGEWDGKTYGSYSARVADRGRMTVGGEALEVWIYELRIELKGELDGTVLAEVAFAPKYALTVQEHYTQDLQSDKGRYRAEWKMTLKSTTPQR